MQTIRQTRQNNEETKIPNGYRANGWSSVLPHEMNVLFHALCYVVTKYETKAEMNQALNEVNALEGTFDTLDKSKFQSEESYQSYINLLEQHKKFLERSNYKYPSTRDEAIALFTQWGLLLDEGEHWDIPIHPFPEAQEFFVLNEREKLALDFIKVETLVHPIFSKLILHLHEQDENTFQMSKADLKQLLNINDAMLLEVLIKLIPYLQEPIENLQEIPDDAKITFTVEWEKVYEDFLGSQSPQSIQQ